MSSTAQGTGAQLASGLTSLWLSARGQGCWLAGTFRRLGQECRRGNAKCLSQSRQCVCGHVLGTTLDPTDIGTINVGRECQSLLRQAPFDTQLAEIPANDLAHVHCAQEGNTNGLTIDGPIVPYFDARGLHGSCACLGE